MADSQAARGPQEPSPGCNPGTRTRHATVLHPERVREGSPAALSARRRCPEASGGGVSPPLARYRPSGTDSEIAESTEATQGPQIDAAVKTALVNPVVKPSLANPSMTCHGCVFVGIGIDQSTE
jgi:hypothetical protein